VNAPHIEISQLWGDSLLRVERFSRTRRLTVGPAHNSDFTAALDEPTVLVDGGTVRSDEGALEITADTDVSIDVGAQTFRIRAVPAERVLGGSLFAHVDWFFMGLTLVLGLTLLLGAIVVVLCVLAFKLLRFLLAILFAAAGVSVPLFLQIPPAPLPVPAVVASAEIGELSKPVAPAPPLWVKPTPKPVPTIAPIPIGDIKSTRVRNDRIAILNSLDRIRPDEQTGIFGVLSGTDRDLSAVFGSGGIEGGYSGGLVGGVSGGELRVGGGGGALGIGGLGGRGNADGVALSGGVVSGKLESEARGTLTREQISGTIQRNLSAIRRCYERALLVDPDLEGKIVLSFQVDASGRVLNARAASSTLTGEVDQCVVAEVSKIVFPIPEGDGLVKVSFPFSFRSAE
jgi:TonB family protein